eukprot:GHVU01014824.1.p2 GENE.GHVU01014824.1~~GHVU01014824.1.p2  ORF type:complete len:117 (+),score=2.66 GHVU01014824.1:2005-2355(+)
MRDCAAAGHIHAGIKEGSVCMCGDQRGQFAGSDGDSICEYDPVQLCGGKGTHTVYIATGMRRRVVRSSTNINEGMQLTIYYFMHEHDVYKALFVFRCSYRWMLSCLRIWWNIQALV